MAPALMCANKPIPFSETKKAWHAFATALCMSAITAFALTSCVGKPTQRDASNPAITALANEVAIQAFSLIHTPYRYGGDSPEGGFDCSGLVKYVFAHAAQLNLPRSTSELSRMPTTEIDRSNLQIGDLVFFKISRAKIDHVAIYIGNSRFVHAPSQGGTVRLDSLQNPYWQKRFFSAKRILIMRQAN